MLHQREILNTLSWLNYWWNTRSSFCTKIDVDFLLSTGQTSELDVERSPMFKAERATTGIKFQSLETGRGTLLTRQRHFITTQRPRCCGLTESELLGNKRSLSYSKIQICISYHNFTSEPQLETQPNPTLYTISAWNRHRQVPGTTKFLETRWSLPSRNPSKTKMNFSYCFCWNNSCNIRNCNLQSAFLSLLSTKISKRLINNVKMI